MTDLAKLVVRLEAQSSQYQAELERATRKLDTFGKKSSSVLGNIGKSLGATAVTAAAGLTKLGKSTIDAIDRFNDMSKKTGVSTEALSQLAYAAKLSGSDIEGVEKGLIKLSKAAIEASTGSKETLSAFNAIGISAKDLAENLNDPDKLLLKIAGKFEGFEDGAGKVAIALKLLGKSGADLIPFLNEGQEGIRKMMEEADRFGQTVSGKSAAAADQFNDNMDRMVAIFKGVANQAIQRLLPALSRLSDEFVEGSSNTDDFNNSVAQLVAGFKALVTGAIVLKSVLFAIGTAMGALAGAAVELFKNMSPADFANPGLLLVKLGQNASGAAGAIQGLKGAFDDIKSGVASDIEKITKLWSDDKDVLEEVHVTVKKIKAELKFSDPKLAEDLQKAADASLKKLQQLNVELQKQVATFDLGDTAAIKYSLTVGELSDDVERLGEKGKGLAESIVATSSALEMLRNNDALKSIDVQILELTGHFNEAAAAAFDLQNKALKGSLESTDDEAGQEKLETLRRLTLAQTEFEQLQNEASKIQNHLAQQEERIQNAVLAGSATELQAMGQISEARKNAVAGLDEILKKQEAIATASGNPQLVENVQRFGVEIESLAAQTDLLAQKIRGGVEESFGSAFADVITGAQTAGDAIKSFIKDVGRQFANLIAQNFAQQLFGGLLGGGGGGAGGGAGGIFGSIASAFMGSMDSGGSGHKGNVYAIGTGAQPELFAPGTSGQFIPKNKWLGAATKVTQQFFYQAPAGTVSRQTQLQTGAEAARGISTANRRNNR